MPHERELDYQRWLEDAEQAASAGDLARAETLLREAARAQEDHLGTAHPDLASTFNNLGIVCEQNGHLGDAEAFYRRAFAIATAVAGPTDPLVETAARNLRDFCQANGGRWRIGPASSNPPRPPCRSRRPSRHHRPRRERPRRPIRRPRLSGRPRGLHGPRAAPRRPRRLPPRRQGRAGRP
ncbi:MAG: tetratricopeptide repeat protein [Vicinamibacterales bacterium]